MSALYDSFPRTGYTALMNLVELRHDLHAHPQLAFQETYASQIVRDSLTRWGIEFREGLARGTGVLGYLPATTGDPQAQTIALRADMDALPIAEKTGLPYASQFPGSMHACGHDGHTTILLGAAERLAKTPHRPNHVLFLFQPAEEGGGGGRHLVEEGCLDGSLLGPKADFVFGLHGWPTVRVGHVATRIGALMASTDELCIGMNGRGGHAATPHLADDPIHAVCHLVCALQQIGSRNVDPFDQVVVTIGKIEGGSATNVIPTSAKIEGTIRTMRPETREFVRRRVLEIAEGVARSTGTTATISLREGYPVLINDAEAVSRFLKVARAELGEEMVDPNGLPTMGGEDFAYYAEAVPSCFFQLGLIPDGKDSYPNVHTPVFDFNDDALETGVRLMVALALSGK